MTDERLIRQIGQALADIKPGDERAVARLTAIVGRMVSADKITVGDISGSTAVAIGSDIRIVVQQITNLPADLISRLNQLADALDRRAQTTLEAAGHVRVRVFLASPGDVGDERGRDMQAIARVQNNPLYKQKVALEVVAWDKPGDSIPMLAAIDPQTAIAEGLARPSECDIVAVILWSRMGTPLDVARYRKPDGGQYLSGTEWEFEDAMAASRAEGRPCVLVYRRIEAPKISLDDPQRDDKITQYERLKALFAGFVNPDGSIRQGYNSYTTPTEFEIAFEEHLYKRIARLIEEGQPKRAAPVRTLKTSPVPLVEWPPGKSPFPGLRAFGPADAPVFFGRGLETDRLLKRLGDPDCRFLAVMGASGSGKSSLVGAGLLPRLAANAIPGSQDWPVVRFTPDAWGEGDPFDALTRGANR